MTMEEDTGDGNAVENKGKDTRKARFNWREGDVKFLPRRKRVRNVSPDGIPFEEWYVQNFNPHHDKKGLFARKGAAGLAGASIGAVRKVALSVEGSFKGKMRAVVKSAVELARTVGAKAGHIEHVVVAAVTGKVAASVARLPAYLQIPVLASFHLGKTVTKAAFVTWTAGQAFAERVAKERGMTAEQARVFRGSLTALDIFTFKPISVALHYGAGFHAGALTAVSLIPPASAAYLAHSTAKHPLATLRAARGVVRDTIARLGSIGKKATSTTSNTTEEELT